MNPFPYSLELRVVGERNYALVSPFMYRMGPVEIVVPNGTLTDLASVPRIVWPIVQPAGLNAGPAVVHDYLYQTGAVPRVVADAVFISALRDNGVPRWRRWVMYAAVRLCGLPAWMSHRKHRRK